jgi:hypothetical protein
LKESLFLFPLCKGGKGDLERSIETLKLLKKTNKNTVKYLAMSGGNLKNQRGEEYGKRYIFF